jgi:hypothetical protein
MRTVFVILLAAAPLALIGGSAIGAAALLASAVALVFTR